MTPKERLETALMQKEDGRYIRERISDDEWDDAMFAALWARKDHPEIVSHRDFREVWRLRMKHKGIFEPTICTLALMAEAVFKHLR